MKYIAVLFGLVSAALWVWSAMIRIPTTTYKDLGELEESLRRVGWISAFAAIASGVSVIASAFSN